MLPDLEAPTEDTSVGAGRYMHRLKEVALQKTIEATAISRINRALRTTTSVPGEVYDYQPRESIEFFRPPSSKDESGWEGPATVVENVPARGQVIIKWEGKDLPCKYGDVRRYLDFGGLTTAEPGSAK